MKKILQYIKSPESDFPLFIIILILINLISYNAFIRFDMTSAKSYSLSKSSVQLVKTLEQPLSVRVFFSSNLPSPYSSTELYLKDLLSEYKGKANKNFSCEFFDMDKPENQTLARNYGLGQIQIRELKDNEVGFRQAWMGLAMTYADRVEIIDGITTEEGLEYKLTTKMSGMISTTSALAGLDGKARLILYKTEKLADFRISGFSSIDSTVMDACSAVNKENMDRIEYEKIDPPTEQIDSLIQKYGIQRLDWNDPETGKGSGVLGLILEYEDNFRIIPLRISRTLFAQNVVSGLENLEEQISENLSSLVSRSTAVGYVTGHGELDINDSQNGAGLFNSLLSDRYTVTEINLSEEDIPSGLRSIIINGPETSYSEEELYKIDQFLMKGGNLIIFADSFKEKNPENQAVYYQQPVYEAIDTGLSKLLDKYGIKIGQNYVLDKNCYSMSNQQYGAIKLNFAPMLQKSNLDKKSPVTKNLGYVIMLQNSSVEVSDNENIKTTVLAKSSPESWLMTDITLNPLYIHEPSDKSSMKSYNLAVISEGKFSSAFESEPVSEENSAQKETFTASSHLSQSIQTGRIFVTGSSKLTTSQLIDEDGQQPVAMFVRNVIDYMNGEEDLCTMRTKGLSLNTLKTNSGKSAAFAKYFNEIGLVVLVAAAGLAVWAARISRRHRIRNKYNPDDRREIKN